MNYIRKIYVETDQNNRFARLEYCGVVLNNIPVVDITIPPDVYDRKTIFQLFLSNGVEIPDNTTITDRWPDFDGDVMRLVRPERKTRNRYANAWYKVFQRRKV